MDSPPGGASPSPMHRTRALSDISGANKHDQRRLELDRQMVWRERPLEEWFRDYLPGIDSPDVVFPPFEVDLENQEQGMYSGLRTGLNDCLETVGWMGYQALTTGRLPDSSPSGSPGDGLQSALRPDMGIYPIAVADPTVHDSSPEARVAWAWAEVLIEVKWDPRAAPFSSRHTPRSPFLPGGRERRLSRGQLVDYAITAFARQHRQFLFMIHFMHDCARFVRFDRAGAAVSEEFDYVARPEVIGAFLYRLSRMSRAERGHDPTVTPASKGEAAMFRELHERFHPDSATARGLRGAVAEGWPVFKLTIDAPFSSDCAAVRRGTLPTTRKFLVGKPMSLSTSVIGTCEKSFVGYDLTTENVVFIQDSWRPDSNATQSEYETYLQLREKATGELYILTLLGGGDVTLQGCAQRTAGYEDGAVSTPPLLHYRLVFKEICRPLEDFTNSLELVRAVTWALVAHSKAWKQCGILHRDVSVESILILDPEGPCLPLKAASEILRHWWHSARHGNQIEDEDALTTRRPGASPFMSARLQEYGPGKGHELADDLESFMHVLNYCGLKNLSHAAIVSDTELAYLVRCLYEAVAPTDVNAMAKGSLLKLEKVQNGTPFVKGIPTDHPITTLLAEMSQLCKQHYEHVVLPEAMMSCPPSPASDTFASGYFCGAQSTLPDYDGLGAEDSSEDEDALSPFGPALGPRPRPDVALSPLRSHDRMVAACMRAIRKVWPTADRRLGPTRTCSLSRRPPRHGPKRTWSESGSSESEMKRKRLRKDTATVSSRVSQRRRPSRY